MALRAVVGPRPGTLPGASRTGAPGAQAQKHVSRQRDKVQPRQTAPGDPSGRPHAPAGGDGKEQGEATRQLWAVCVFSDGRGGCWFTHKASSRATQYFDHIHSLPIRPGSVRKAAQLEVAALRRHYVCVCFNACAGCSLQSHL